MTGLARAVGNRTVELDFDDLTMIGRDGARWSTDAVAGAADALTDMIDKVSQAGEANESFREVLARIAPGWLDDPLHRFFVSNYLTFDTGAISELSAGLCDEGEKMRGPEVVIADGYDRIATYLSGGLDIRLRKEVQSVSASEGRVTLGCRDGTEFIADEVIVAVPLGVLKAQTITFAPPLPHSILEAIGGIGFNCVDKYLFTWDHTFWDDSDFVGYASADQDAFSWFLNMNRIHPGSNALMTFAYADTARAMESLPDSAVIERVAPHMRLMYGSRIPAPVQVVRSAWGQDPYTRGSYSFTSTTTRMDHFDRLAEAVGNMHFAGEHTHRDYYSTVHGAYLSGRRAADEVLR
ncbi:monoamine oxidase [Mycobacteroides chelonae]|nr:monoamine oxidase [Mycobacteroides chelonae]